MSNMTVHILGITYFNVCSMRDQPKYVLAPNGRREDGKIPPHFASIFVEQDRCEGDDWWEDERQVRELSIFNLRGERVTVPVIEFRIPAPVPGANGEMRRTQLTFPDGDSGRVKVGNLERGLGHLKTLDREFDPDIDHGNWITRIAIRGGELDAFSLNGGLSTVRWKTGHDGPLTITATQGKDMPGEDTRTVRVQSNDSKIGTEVVFMNSPELLTGIDPTKGPLHVRARVPHGQGNVHEHTKDEHHHFQLYNEINRGPHHELDIPSHLKSLPFGHAVLKYIGDARIHSSCTGTCC